jgi:phosphoglycolate phosphatase
MGDGISATIAKAGRARGADFSKQELIALTSRFLKIYSENPVRNTNPYPGVMSVLAQLRSRGFRIGVCTNKSLVPAELVLEHIGIRRYLSAVVASDSGFGIKPEPGPLLETCRALGCEPCDVVYVGDHAIDVKTAKAAGIAMVAVRYGYGDFSARCPGVSAYIDAIEELPGELNAILGSIVEG